MHKLAQKLFALSLIVLGALIMAWLDMGSGFDSPGFWLVPIGAAWALSLIIREKGLRRARFPLITWSVTLLCVAAMQLVVRYDPLFEHVDIFALAYLAVLSAIVAMVTTIIILFKRN